LFPFRWRRSACNFTGSYNDDDEEEEEEEKISASRNRVCIATRPGRESKIDSIVDEDGCH